MNAIFRQKGFTVVETLIVLAVVGVIFVATAISVQGDINQNRQKDSLAQLTSGIQNILNDVSNGKYNSSNKLACTISGSKIATASISTGSSSFGTGSSNSCVYAGKQVQFYSNYYTVVTYATLDSDVSAIADAIQVSGSDVTVKYVGGITLESSKPPSINPFYIFNKNYAASASTSGNQDVSFYSSLSSGGQLTSNIKVCLVNGGVKSSIIIGSDTTLTNKLVDSSC